MYITYVHIIAAIRKGGPSEVGLAGRIPRARLLARGPRS